MIRSSRYPHTFLSRSALDEEEREKRRRRADALDRLKRSWTSVLSEMQGIVCPFASQPELNWGFLEHCPGVGDVNSRVCRSVCLAHPDECKLYTALKNDIHSRLHEMINMLEKHRSRPEWRTMRNARLRYNGDDVETVNIGVGPEVPLESSAPDWDAALFSDSVDEPECIARESDEEASTYEPTRLTCRYFQHKYWDRLGPRPEVHVHYCINPLNPTGRCGFHLHDWGYCRLSADKD